MQLSPPVLVLVVSLLTTGISAWADTLEDFLGTTRGTVSISTFLARHLQTFPKAKTVRLAMTASDDVRCTATTPVLGEDGKTAVKRLAARLVLGCSVLYGKVAKDGVGMEVRLLQIVLPKTVDQLAALLRYLAGLENLEWGVFLYSDGRHLKAYLVRGIHDRLPALHCIVLPRGEVLALIGVLGHTHPTPTRHSQADLEVLRFLHSNFGQRLSLVAHRQGWTVFDHFGRDHEDLPEDLPLRILYDAVSE